MMEGMQPIYGQTRGLGNKTITKAITQVLSIREMEREYIPTYIRQKYELAEYNYALSHIHFPKNQKELLFARKRVRIDKAIMS